MMPLVAAAIGTWTLPHDWPIVAIRMAVIWGALVLAFVGGVRRGFGFGVPTASTVVEIVTAAIYLGLAGLAMIVPAAGMALALLMIGYVLVALLDRRAAVRGDAPAHFALIRPPQMLIGVASLAVLWVWVNS